MAEKDDNLAPLVTQCPNCDARFRVTESQLQVAHGRVRCGACLSVFDATAQLLMDGERLSANPDTDVDALLDELDDSTSRNAETVPADVETAATASVPASGDAGAVEQVTPNAQSADAEADKAADEEPTVPAELLALEAALLDELKGSGEERSVGVGDVAPNEAGDEDAQAWVGELGEENWTGSDQPAHEPADQDLQAIEEPAIPIKEAAAATHEAAENSPTMDSQAADSQAADSQAADSQPADSAAEDPPAEQPADPLPAEAVAAAQPANRFEDLRIPEPPVFEEADRPRRSWTTLALIGIAVVALPAQVLWFQFDTWSKDERYRPMYGAICAVLGCALPVMRDLTKLERREFHMRHHPESDNAYIFDLLIVNVADFPQPYPVIELIASTERGSLVAGRRFKPEEYLHGEVQPTDLLPPKTPVHVSLEIEHPGHPNLEFQTRFR